MSTLLAVYNSNGCVGRCDASCYDAKHDKCVCICGGRNHGKGYIQASENALELYQECVEKYDKVEVTARQLRLFDIEKEGKDE